MSYGTGAIVDRYDLRDYRYIARGAFDWAKGYDIENEIGAKLVVKDQNGSGSCGGQAWSYYGEVLETIATGTYEPRSARWVYAPVAVPGGGSAGRDLCAFVIKNGWALEKDAISYDNGKPPREEFMKIVPVLDSAGKEVAEVSRALSYLNVSTDMESIANAIADNHGVCIGIRGEDNGTWRTAFPKPPKNPTWAHWVYCAKVKTIKGKKYIGFINSWGESTGANGWQWIGEEYFTKDNIFSAWTLAWDYKPAAHKVLLIKTIALLKELLAKLTK
jgi:hypothetical protein